jgi:hypothetical protein
LAGDTELFKMKKFQNVESKVSKDIKEWVDREDLRPTMDRP